MYQAPYRNDSQASLKVSHRENLWIDFGTNEGGTLIDLVLKIYPQLNISEAMKDISETTNFFFSFHQQKAFSQNPYNGEESRFGSWSAPDPKHDSMGQRLKAENQLADREKIISKKYTSKKGADNRYYLISKTGADNVQYLKDNTGTSNICRDNTEYILDKAATQNIGTSKKQNPIYNRGTINIYKLQELGNNPAITDYLNQRGIQIATSKPYCKEIYYQVNQKRYFGLAHKSNNGWSIRNKYWKGCTAQGYSYYNIQQDTLLIFEGIFDMLSFLEMRKIDKNSTDIMILNSLVNIKKALPILEQYTFIKLYFDHDEAGRKATREILHLYSHAEDASGFYHPFKDINEYYLKKGKDNY